MSERPEDVVRDFLNLRTDKPRSYVERCLDTLLAERDAAIARGDRLEEALREIVALPRYNAPVGDLAEAQTIARRALTDSPEPE